MRVRSVVEQRCRGTKAEGAERVVAFLDLENLLHLYRARAEWGNAWAELNRLLRGLGARRMFVGGIAAADRVLASRMAFGLKGLSIRTFTHHGGADAADRILLERLWGEVPDSADVVVIGSGDHIFAGVARFLRRRGKRIEVIARAGAISGELYRAADAVHILPSSIPADLSGASDDD